MGIFGTIQGIILFALTVAAFVAELLAFVHCATRPAQVFPAAGKRTKTFWLAITGVAALVGLLAVPPGRMPLFLGLIAAGAAIVYLVDVRPNVSGPRRPRGRGSGSGW